MGVAAIMRADQGCHEEMAFLLASSGKQVRVPTGPHALRLCLNPHPRDLPAGHWTKRIQGRLAAALLQAAKTVLGMHDMVCRCNCPGLIGRVGQAS